MIQFTTNPHHGTARFRQAMGNTYPQNMKFTTHTHTKLEK